MKKRIVLSDDDDDMEVEVSTPSTKLLAASLGDMKMMSARKNVVTKAALTPKVTEEDCYTSDNEIDPELTRKVMQGSDSDVSETENLYFRSEPASKSTSKSGRPTRGSAVYAQEKLKAIYATENSVIKRRGRGHKSESDASSEGSEDSESVSRGTKTPASRRSSASHRSTTNRTTPPSSSSSSGRAIQSSRTSERCKAVQSRQNAKRDAALDDLQRKSQSGLGGILLSSSDEDGGQDDEAAGDTSAPSSDDEVSFLGTRVQKRNAQQSSASRAPPRNKAAAPAAKLLGDSGRGDMYEEVFEGEEGSLSDFIVGSDEEREEEAERERASRQRRKERRQERDRASATGGSGNGRPAAAASRKRSSAASWIADEDEEEEEEEFEGGGGGNNRCKHSSKRAKPGSARKSKLRVDDDEEEEEEQEEEAESGNSEDDEGGSGGSNGSSEDEQLLYLQMNARHDQEAEELEEDMGGDPLMAFRKSFKQIDAIRLYIELLARSLVDPHFMAQYCTIGGGARNAELQRAARQIENLICTNRESLLGSSAWKKEFLEQLCSRPFYTVTSHSGGAGLCGDHCEACGKKSQRPDHQVYLFGSTYDARKVWSANRWDLLLPQMMFLHGESSSTVSKTANQPRSRTAAAESPLAARIGSSGGWRNKQFAEFKSIAQGGSGSKAVKKDRSAVQQLLGEDVGRSLLSINWRKRRVVELSDEEEEIEADEAALRPRERADSGNGRYPVTPHEKTKKQRVEETSSSSSSRKVICLDGDQGVEECYEEVPQPPPHSMDDEEEEEEAEEQGATLIDEQANAWWRAKWPRELTREKETRWHLAQHCKNRTQLYHTLLHYKFRLLLKIRARLEADRRRLLTEGHQQGSSWSTVVDELLSDPQFVAQEHSRFENLLRHAGKKWGRSEEVAHNDIWSDGEGVGLSRSAQVSRNSGGTNYIRSSAQYSAKKGTATLSGWLSKQNTL